MKNLLLGLLVISSLCSFTKKKKKPEQAFEKRSFTAIAGTGWSNVFTDSRSKSIGPINVGADYQASKRWSFGFQYTFNYTKTDVRKFLVYPNSFMIVGTPIIPTDSFLYQQKATYHSFMATADFCYVNKKRLCLSSGIGLGYTPYPTVSTRFPDNIDHSTQLGDRVAYLPFAFRLRLLNARVRITDRLGAFGSVSYGVDGFLLAGATYTFTGRNRL